MTGLTGLSGLAGLTGLSGLTGLTGLTGRERAGGRLRIPSLSLLPSLRSTLESNPRRNRSEISYFDSETGFAPPEFLTPEFLTREETAWTSNQSTNRLPPGGSR